MSKMTFGDLTENVVTRDEFPLSRAQEVLRSEVVAVVGYGVQGPAQAQNLRDNGIAVVVGQRSGTKSWESALRDGWKEGETLFDLEEACARGSIICNLLSDAGMIEQWPKMEPYLSKGKALCFSHGFGITFSSQTHIMPPADIDVVLVAPKGSGRSVRRLFLEKRGINSSYAVYQDATGNAQARVLALGMAIGSGYLFETTIAKEAVSDLVGERGVLMGALAGIIQAQYNILRAKGHTPSEAFNETVEELTQSLVPLVAENGMDWMYANCSTTAQRGALDWAPRFREAVEPVFSALYDSVESGKEAAIVIEANSRPDYKERLEAELAQWRNSELWRAGAQVRKLRP